MLTNTLAIRKGNISVPIIAVHPLKLFIRVSIDAKSEYGQPDGLLLTSHPSNLKFGNFADILIVIEQYPERCGRRATSEFTYGARRLN